MAIDLTRNLPRPAGHHTVTPGFAVPNAGKVLEFLEGAFGAKVVDRYEGPGGSIAHAELLLGDSVVMLGEAGAHQPAMPASLSYWRGCRSRVQARPRRRRDLDHGPEESVLRLPQRDGPGCRRQQVDDLRGDRRAHARRMQRRMQDMK